MYSRRPKENPAADAQRRGSRPQGPQEIVTIGAARATLRRLPCCVIARTGPIATLIEWDNDIPDWPMLCAEAAAAERILAEASRASAA